MVTKTDPAPPPPPPPPPPPAAGGRVGVLQVVNKYGIYVWLDAKSQLGQGDVLEVWREGKVIGEITVDKTNPPEKNYPNGSLECRKGTGAVQKGDEVRLKK